MKAFRNVFRIIFDRFYGSDYCKFLIINISAGVVVQEMPNLQVVHLLLGLLCLLGHRVGQRVLYHPLSHESQGPHEDQEVPPSQVPLWALQVLELPRATQREAMRRPKWKLSKKS